VSVFGALYHHEPVSDCFIVSPGALLSLDNDVWHNSEAEARLSPFTTNLIIQLLQQSSLTLPPSQIRTAARQTALQQIEVQKAEFKQLGIMADWDGSAGVYRTLGAF